MLLSRLYWVLQCMEMNVFILNMHIVRQIIQCQEHTNYTRTFGTANRFGWAGFSLRREAGWGLFEDEWPRVALDALGGGDTPVGGLVTTSFGPERSAVRRTSSWQTCGVSWSFTFPTLAPSALFCMGHGGGVGLGAGLSEGFSFHTSSRSTLEDGNWPPNVPIY